MDLLKSSSKFSKKQIILLSIPVFFSNIAIPLVGIVDTGLMGNLGETKYLAATIESRYCQLGSGLIPVDSLLGDIENIAVG